MGIITSWLDNDLYNFHQGSFFFMRHRDAVGTYAYKCRSKGVNLWKLKEAILAELTSMSTLLLGSEEADYLKAHTLCDAPFVDALTYRPILDMADVTLQITPSRELELRYTGPIYKRILVETPLLATISQLYYEATMSAEELATAHKAGEAWLVEQCQKLVTTAPVGFKFTEGGTRRRFSKAHHETALQTIMAIAPQCLGATTNVLMGKKFGIKTVGTMAHQLQMYYQTICPVEDSIVKPLLDWNDHFKGLLGTALTDTLGDRKWDFDFRGLLMALYHTERHDSACPFGWGEKRLRALAREGVDTEGRCLLFSDSLDFDKAFALWNHFCDRIGVGIMIGTFFLNTIPVEGHKPVSQVIKLMWAAASADALMRPVVKLSADMDKSQCECPTLTEHAKWVAESCPLVDVQEAA